MTLINEIIYVFFEMAPYLMFGFLFAGVLNVFINKDIIIKHLGHSSVGAVVKASIFGVPLPLCSCSVIPTAISIKKSGASNAASLSFLLSTPLTGVDSIVATYGVLGPVFGIFRPIAALFIGVIGGISGLVVKTEKNEELEPVKVEEERHQCCCSKKKKNKIVQIFEYAFKTLLDDIALPLLAGVLVSGLISWIIPDNFFADINLPIIVQMLIMVVVGVPLYICATSSLPIAAALLFKGLSPGVIFVFLVAGPATNSATVALIVKEFGKKFFILYFTVISALSICFGLLLDFIVNNLNLSVLPKMMHNHEHGISPLFMVIGIVFFILIMGALYRKFIKNRKNSSESCNH